MRRMIHQYYQRRTVVDPPVLAGEAHLDDDALNAFIEGRLSNAESTPLVKHLVACALCRRITAQLVRLESETKATDARTPATQQEPGRIRRLLEDLASRVLPSSGDEAVFAYHAPAEDFRPKGQADDEQKEAGDEDEKDKPDTDDAGIK